MLYTNGNEIRGAYVNNMRLEKVYVNNTLVFTQMNGAITMVATGNASGTFSPGEEDIDRHFVVVSGRFASGGLSIGPIPTINGISCTTILNDVDNGNDDGGRCGVFMIKIPTGESTFTISNADSAFAVYRVVGMQNLTAFALASNSGGSSISLLVPPKGFSVIVGVRNFNTAAPISNTDTDLRYSPGNPAIAAARVNNTESMILSYGSADYSQMMRAVSFEYDNRT